MTSVNYSLNSVNLCPNSMLKSPLLKHLHEYARILSLKFPKFCYLGRHYFVKSSLYLLQVINPFFCTLSQVVSFGSMPTKKWTLKDLMRSLIAKVGGGLLIRLGYMQGLHSSNLVSYNLLDESLVPLWVLRWSNFGNNADIIKSLWLWFSFYLPSEG